MYEYHDFHESYYNHSCSIIPEKDVLDIDIAGSGFVARIQRWWHDLFLLSYTDYRSRIFYNSSHAMRVDRMQQYRRFRNRIHPLSQFRSCWDCLLLQVFITSILLFHFTSSILFDKLCYWYFYISLMLDLIVIADLYVCFKTGYIDKEARRIVLDTNKCLMHYCSTKLFFHVASALPLTWLLFLRFGSLINCGICKANYFVCVLKVISVFRLFRVYEKSAFLTRTRPSLKWTYACKFVRIGVLGLVTMFKYIDISDMVCLITILERGSVIDTSLLRTLLAYRYGVALAPRNFEFAVFDLSRMLGSLVIFNISLRDDAYRMDEVSSMLAFALSNIFFMWGLIECYGLNSSLKYYEDKALTAKRSTLNILQCRELPDKLVSKVETYFEFSLSKYKMVEKCNELYVCLPPVLKREAMLNRYSTRLRRISYFSEWPLEMIEELVLLLELEIYLKNDVVSDAWAQGAGLFIVDMGVLAVYNIHHIEIGHLIDGDYFGEISLVTDTEVQMSHVAAVTRCSVLILKKQAFRHYMREHPKLFFEMKRVLSERYSRGEHVSSTDSVISRSRVDAGSEKNAALLSGTSYD